MMQLETNVQVQPCVEIGDGLISISTIQMEFEQNETRPKELLDEIIQLQGSPRNCKQSPTASAKQLVMKTKNIMS